MEEYQNNKTPWRELLSPENIRKYKLKGFNIGDGRQYGIHLSISRSLFTTLHAAKFIVWFNQQVELVQLVAQRKKIYGGSYNSQPNIKGLLTEKYDVDSYDVSERRFKKKTKDLQTKKYEPVAIDDKRLEVRVFASNIKWNRILKNVEFVQAVFDFTKSCGISVVATPKGTTEFLHWLTKQNGYNALKQYLAEMKNHKKITYPDQTEFDTASILKDFSHTPKSPKATN